MFGFVLPLLLALVGIVVSGILLWFSTKIFHLKNATFRNALSVAAIVGIINFVLGYGLVLIPFVRWFGGVVNFVVTIILGLLLVKRKYKLNGSKTFLVWVVWFLMAFIASAILAALFAALFVGAALAIGAGSLLS